jgi:alpha-galactosidase
MDISATIRPGAFNDPDMLEIGNGGMTADEYRLHMTLWSMLSAPLLAGNDLRTMTDEIKGILMNMEVIAVNQDKLVAAPKNVAQTASTLVLTKQMANNTTALAFFNRGDADTQISVALKDLGLTSSGLKARDLWAHTDVSINGASYTATVPKHGVVMLKVSGR